MATAVLMLRTSPSRCLGANEQWLRLAEALKTGKVFLNAGENRVQWNLAAIVEGSGL